MWSGNLAPDDPDLGSSNLLLRPIDKGNLLSEVEVGCVGIIHTLDLDQARVWVCVALAALVAQMATPTENLCQSLVQIPTVRSTADLAVHPPFCFSSSKGMICSRSKIGHRLTLHIL